jgi:hypothetical protein
MGACFRVRVAVQLFRIPVQDRPAHPLHHHYWDLPGTGDALQLVPQPLAGCQLADLNPPSCRELPQRRLKGPGVQLGPVVGSPQGRHPLLPGQRVLTCEQPLHRLVFSDAMQAGPLGQGADPPARRLALPRVVLAAVTSDLVQPVSLLTHPQRRHTKRQTNTSP